jgi:hypothetical protein
MPPFGLRLALTQAVPEPATRATLILGLHCRHGLSPQIKSQHWSKDGFKWET